MSVVSFDALPDAARLWIFGADRELDQSERELVSQAVHLGLSSWAAHGSPVTWGHTIVHDRFLMIGVDESHTALTGCSIDSAVHEIAALEKKLGVSLLDNGRVFFRDREGLRAVSRAEFRDLARERTVSPRTVVFNNIIATIGDYRRGLWEVPLRDSWHAKAFPVEA